LGEAHECARKKANEEDRWSGREDLNLRPHAPHAPQTLY
jgi:hypothetical protein